MKYEPNRAGLREVLRADYTQSVVREQAERLAADAGDGFEASYMQGSTRFRGIVYAGTWSAKRREARDNILVRVLG